MAFRIVDTSTRPVGPTGIRYVHDAARPFAIMFDKGYGEMCALRCSTEDGAKAAVEKFTAARARYAARNVQVA